MYWGAICDIAQATFVRSDALVNSIQIRSIREADINVRIFEPETRVHVRSDFIVCFDDVLDVGFHEIIEGINMLFYETLYFEKGREQ